jgi:hypothetical protein
MKTATSAQDASGTLRAAVYPGASSGFPVPGKRKASVHSRDKESLGSLRITLRAVLHRSFAGSRHSSSANVDAARPGRAPTYTSQVHRGVRRTRADGCMPDAKPSARSRRCSLASPGSGDRPFTAISARNLRARSRRSSRASHAPSQISARPTRLLAAIMTARCLSRPSMRPFAPRNRQVTTDAAILPVLHESRSGAPGRDRMDRRSTKTVSASSVLLPATAS